MDASHRWWQPDRPPGVSKADWETTRATALLTETAQIEQRQSSWHEFNLWNSMLYYNRELPAFRWGINLDAEQELFPADLRTENLVRSIGESMVSKACSQPLIPSPVPHGASYTAKQAVDKLKVFIASTYIITEAESAAVQAFLDAYVSHIGAVRIDHSGGKLRVAPVFFDNVIVDNRECVNRMEPRTIRIRTVLPRAAVEAEYGELSGQQPKNYVDYREVGTDWVVLVEAWRKPDSRGKGGRHTIACCGQLLADAPWTHDWTPVVIFHWSDCGSGFFSYSGVEQCIPYQVLQNELNEAIRKAQDICSTPRLLAHANSNIDVNQWDNEAGRILGYTGEKPEAFIWPTNLVDLYNERERNRARANSDFGISEMSTGADLPQQVRLDSSAGVREFRNMEDSRHLRLWTRFEKFRMEIAKRIISVLAASGGGYKVSPVAWVAARAGSVDTDMMSWDDIKTVQDCQFSWTFEAVPLAAQSPAARRETLSAWQSEGKIRPDDDVSMVGNPDLERIEQAEMASVNEIKRQLAAMERGEPQSPAEYDNLTWGIPACVQNIHELKGYTDGVHPDAIALHESWLLQALNQQQAAATALQAQQPAPPPPGYAPQQGVQGQIQ